MTNQWLGQVTKQLNVIRDLEANWDSYDALAPDPDIIERANRFAGMLESHGVPQPHVNPTRAGGVQFEWGSLVGYCELEFMRDNKTQLCAMNATEKEERGKTMTGWSSEYVVEYLRFAGVMT